MAQLQSKADMKSTQSFGHSPPPNTSFPSNDQKTNKQTEKEYQQP